MERLYTKEVVVHVLKNVLEFEKSTLNLYKDYLNQLVDKETVEIFRLLREEEVQHVESIEKLINGLN